MFTSRLVSIYVILFCAFVASACTFTSPTNFPRDNSIEINSYIPNFTNILGDNWSTGEVVIATVSDDFKGRPATLIYRADVSTFHQADDFPLVRYTVLIYEDASAALERYEIQKEVLFFDDPRDTLTWYDISISDIQNADQFHTACMDVMSESVGASKRCTGIFLYGQNVIVLRIRSVNGDIEYISEELIVDMFQAVEITPN